MKVILIVGGVSKWTVHPGPLVVALEIALVVDARWRRAENQIEAFPFGLRNAFESKSMTSAITSATTRKLTKRGPVAPASPETSLRSARAAELPR